MSLTFLLFVCTSTIILKPKALNNHQKMNLFEPLPNANTNLLPYDGTVNYYGPIMSDQMAGQYFKKLINNIAWQQDEVILFGKKIVTKREVAWYGNTTLSYTYSNVTKQAKIWTEDLLALKNMIENHCGITFNSCLLNLYHNGGEGMGWHSDDEKTLQTNGAIASLSLGAERKFSFRHKRHQEQVSVQLANGSLLLMKDETQTHWQHTLPKALKIKTPRINLTFRNIIIAQ
jgi:alkylated DNA repair dioxygenase AlkB